MPTTYNHIMSDETGQQLHTDLGNVHADLGTTMHGDLGNLYTALATILHGDFGTTLHADLQALVAAGTTRYDAAIAAANGAVATANATALLQENDRLALSGTYPGRALTDVLDVETADDVYAAMHVLAAAKEDGGINIGDYVDVAIGSATVNRGQAMRYRVGGIGHGYRFGDQECPWAFWMVPDEAVDMTGSSYAINTSYIYWNTTANNNGTSSEKRPYLGSNLHAWETSQFVPALPSALRSVLVNHRILFEERYSASGSLNDSTGWSWADAGLAFSLSETEVYGQCVWGTKGYSVGADAQLPIFRDSRYRMKNRVTWWLRSVASGSASNVCHVGNNGVAYSYSATSTWVRPLPCFLIG